MLKISSISPLWTEGAFSCFWEKDLEWIPGEVVEIRGRSGRGKTSLIRFLTGQSFDYKGEIYWNDKENRQQSPEDWSFLRSRYFSLVPQNLELLDMLTPEENVLLRLRMQDSIRDNNAWREQWEFLNLPEKTKSDPRVFSQGEKQRVAVLRSLQGPFKWLILDESFSHLDGATAQKCWDLISEVCRKNGAGIITTSLDGGPGKPTRVLDL